MKSLGTQALYDHLYQPRKTHERNGVLARMITCRGSTVPGGMLPQCHFVEEKSPYFDPDYLTSELAVTDNHWIGGYVGHRAAVWMTWRKFLKLPGLELRTLGRPPRR
jgi:hypothetical protein